MGLNDQKSLRSSKTLIVDVQLGIIVPGDIQRNARIQGSPVMVFQQISFPAKDKINNVVNFLQNQMYSMFKF